MKAKTFYPLLNSLAIEIPAGERAQYVYGDNLEGYFEGWTGSIGAGDGYRKDNETLIRDVVSLRQGRLAPREAFRRAEICPHLVRHHYSPFWSEELMLPHRRHGLVARVAHTRPTRLALAPVLDAEEVTVREEDATMVHLTCAGRGQHVAVAADRGIRCTAVRRVDAGVVPVLEARRPATGLTLYIGIGPTAARALERAEALRMETAEKVHARSIGELLSKARLHTGDAAYDKALAWAALTSYFMVTEEFGKGIWAGLPWFKNNWGRDTFIALPGTLLVTGHFKEARDVIASFFRYQDKDPGSPTYGRVPNRVQSATDIIYNTTDGTPWLIREVFEYLQYTGDTAFAKKVYPSVKLALEGALQTHVDDEGFLTHDDADTWMDARIEGDLPWSARGNRANDIQALWHNALRVGAVLARGQGDETSAVRWDERADLLHRHFAARFWNEEEQRLADRITETGRRDEKVRPNQLMVLSIPQEQSLLTEAQEKAVLEGAVRELLYPYGIASLSQRDPYFHPYHHHPERHHHDAAYHNGTVWGWNAGFTVTALCRHRQQALAWDLARNLAGQILHMGCRGSMSELVEAIPRTRGRIQLSGTWAQAWSTSEFTRNGYQDFLGFRPRLLEKTLELAPALPPEWNTLEAHCPFGRHGLLQITREPLHGADSWTFYQVGHPRPLTLQLRLESEGMRYDLTLSLRESHSLRVTLQDGEARIRRHPPVAGTPLPRVRKLRFAKPSLAAKPPALRKKHFLQNIIERGDYR